MALKFRITYRDGRVVDVAVTPRAQVMAEQHFKGVGDANMLQAGYFMAWASLNRSGKEPTEFEPWLDLIEDVEEASPNGQVDDLDPTQTEPPPGSSSSSASEPESPSSPSST